MCTSAPPVSSPQGCKKTFKSISGLRSHVKQHSEETILCPVCKRVMQTPKRLLNHLRSKHASVSDAATTALP